MVELVRRVLLLVALHTHIACARVCREEVERGWFRRWWDLADCTTLSLRDMSATQMATLVPAIRDANITVLDLSESPFGDEGAAMLADGLRWNATGGPPIQFIDLSYCKIGDTGAAALSEALKSNDAVRMLVLRGPPISNAAQALIGDVVKVDPATRRAHYAAMRESGTVAHSVESNTAPIHGEL